MSLLCENFGNKIIHFEVVYNVLFIKKDLRLEIISEMFINITYALFSNLT